MRKKISLCGMLLALGAALLMTPAPSLAVVYDMELLCLVDVSGSIDTTEFNLQRTGYANAFKITVPALFNDPNLTVKPFYVSYGTWSGANQQSQQVGWTLIDSAAASIAFGNAIAAAPRLFSNNTAIQTALNWGYPLFNNGIDSIRQVIDISGDGVRNEGLTGTLGRDAALLAGVDSINGLAIGGDLAVHNYYLNNVVGGSPGFLIDAASFTDFESALARKITYEVTGIVPVPPSVLLLGSGLLGLVGWRRFRKS